METCLERRIRKKRSARPEKWTYEEGFVRNKEDQYYTKNRRQNARVEKGCLIIEARKEPFNNPKYDPKATPNSGRNPANRRNTPPPPSRRKDWRK